MKYKIFLTLLFLLNSCTPQSINNSKLTYNATGFAYIFNSEDFQNNIIKTKLDNSSLQVSHKYIRSNSLIKIINPKTQDYLIIKNFKRSAGYPDLYQILITKAVAEKLKLNSEIPYVEIIEIKKNKSFIAEKAKIYNEEKKISGNAPVTSVEISNISKAKKKFNRKKNDIFILIATFYSNEVALFLKERIIKEIPDFDNNKLKITKKSSKEIDLISGPYSTINLMKNDYINLKKFGFEELEIRLDE